MKRSKKLSECSFRYSRSPLNLRSACRFRRRSDRLKDEAVQALMTAVELLLQVVASEDPTRSNFRSVEKAEDTRDHAALLQDCRAVCLHPSLGDQQAEVQSLVPSVVHKTQRAEKNAAQRGSLRPNMHICDTYRVG